MKTSRNLLLSVIVATFCASLASAQQSLIYSNNFTLGGTGNITNTPPTVANNVLGGSNTAVWQDVLGVNDGGDLQANGVDNTTVAGTSWVLPFTPQSNHVYALTLSINFTNYPGNWVGFGFAQYYTNNFTSGFGRFSDNEAGYDWMILTESTGNVQYFEGPKGVPAAGLYNANNTFPASTGAETVTGTILLNTQASLWTMAAYVNGVQMGTTNVIFPTTSINTNIHAVGITQTTLSSPNGVQFLNMTLAATYAPFVTTEPNPAKTLGAGSAYTNSIGVTVDTNAGAVSYQWYANNLPLTNGINNVSGATSSNLVINPVSSANQSTNYYAVVSNLYGSATSTVASLTVLTNPVITAPATSPTAIELFSGSGSVYGSSPTFSVTAVGAPPLSYYWYTNGVLVPGVTGTTLSLTNLQAGAPTTFACVVSNSFGTANNTWNASYLAAPTAAYPQAVLASQPLYWWRLNEQDNGSYNEGVVCHDYASGNNAIYTNVLLGQQYYNSLETTETSMYATPSGLQFSYAGRDQDGDFATTRTNGVNAQFTVEAWANCLSGNAAAGGAPVVSQGQLNVSTFFLGVDTNSTKHYEFYVRSAAGTIYKADDATIMANDLNWHYLVGVCDEAHGTISLYIDGTLSTSTAIPTNSGLFDSGMPITIGAGILPPSTDYNIPFTGNIDDVAIYPSALSYGTVINHFTDVNNNTVAVSFVPPQVPSTFGFVSGRTFTIPATVAGGGSVSYYWTNVTTGGLLASGSTTSGSTDATLTVPNAPASLSGDQLELVAYNSSSSTSTFVTLFSPAAPVVLPDSSPILYSNNFNGGTYPLAGNPPTAANVLVGGTNTVWVDELGTNDTGGGMGANGIPNYIGQDSWVLPFTPHQGYVYTINTSLTFFGNPGNWVGPGFAEYVLTNSTDGRFNGLAEGYDWMILTESSGNLQYFAGVSTAGTITNKTPFFTAGAATHSVQVVLDATGTSWKAYGYIDGSSAGTNTYSTKPSIGAVGFTQNTLTSPANTNVQWNYFALTQVAPGGVPPYLLNPLPPTNNITLTGTVSLSATAYGSAPFGYYWTNNSTVVASGSSSTMDPLNASLSVAASSLSAGTLQLVVTNAYGTNITSITLVSSVNTNRGPILYSLTNNQLTLNWPTNLGWTLQAQTNSLSVGLGTNWVNVPNSSTTNKVTVTLNPTNGAVFYRLVLP